MLDKKKLYELKKESKLLEPIVRIGKNGVTEGTLKEIEILLRKRKLIKIKILKNAVGEKSIDDIINSIITKYPVILVDKIGLTFSLFKGKSL